MALDETVASPVPTTLGAVRLILDDLDGTPAKMGAEGHVGIKDAAGDEQWTRRGDPEAFMPATWKAKVKDVLDELRAEVASRLSVNGS